MNLRHFFKQLIDSQSAKYADIASYLNFGRDIKTSAQTLTNKFNPNSDSHLPNIDECYGVLEMLNGWQPLAVYAAERCQSVVVALPDESAIACDMSLLDAFMKTVESDGVFAYEFQEAWRDGRISAHEFSVLEHKQYAAIGMRLALLAEIKRVVR